MIGGGALLDSQLRDNGALNGTQTYALLPGSLALGLIRAPCPVGYTDAASGMSVTATTDQRGVTRSVSGDCDSGAFESQGLTVTATAGDNGIAATNGTFATLLTATVSSMASEPVVGGQVTYHINGGSNGTTGAFTTTGTNCTVPNADLTTAICPVASNGAATAPALTANGIVGVFAVTAGASGIATPVTFTLAYPTMISGITRTPYRRLE